MTIIVNRKYMKSLDITFDYDKICQFKQSPYYIKRKTPIKSMVYNKNPNIQKWHNICIIITMQFKPLKVDHKNLQNPKVLYRDHSISPFRIGKNTYQTTCGMIVRQKLLDETSKKKGKLPKCKNCSRIENRQFMTKIIT